MLCCRDFENLADVRLLKPISADAFAEHSRPTLTTQVIAPSTFRVVLADPAHTKANPAFSIWYAGCGTVVRHEET